MTTFNFSNQPRLFIKITKRKNEDGGCHEGTTLDQKYFFYMLGAMDKDQVRKGTAIFNLEFKPNKIIYTQ